MENKKMETDCIESINMRKVMWINLKTFVEVMNEINPGDNSYRYVLDVMEKMEKIGEKI